MSCSISYSGLKFKRTWEITYYLRLNEQQFFSKETSFLLTVLSELCLDKVRRRRTIKPTFTIKLRRWTATSITLHKFLFAEFAVYHDTHN